MAKEKEAKTKKPTALKRKIQSEKKRLINRTFRSRVRTAIRDLEDLVKTGSEDKASQLQTVYSLLDKGVKRGIYKVNKASRTKSRLAAHLARS